MYITVLLCPDFQTLVWVWGLGLHMATNRHVICMNQEFGLGAPYQWVVSGDETTQYNGDQDLMRGVARY